MSVTNRRFQIFRHALKGQKLVANGVRSMVVGLWSKLGKRGRSLGWSFAGQILPMLAGILFVPLLIHTLGTERFGFLSLVWILIGYFSLFDLGLSRALTQRVSGLIARAEFDRVKSAAHTGMALIVVLGLISIPILMVSRGIIIDQMVHPGAALAREAGDAFTWLVFGVPIVIFSAGVRGILEGEHRFAAVNLVRAPAGVMMFVGPWLATRFNQSLEAATFAVLIVRLMQTVGFVYLARELVGSPISWFSFDRTEVKMLFGFGLWMTVSNVISPLLVYLDRFMISRFGDLKDVAYYSTPFDLVARLLFISNSVAAVMFPVLSAAHATQDGTMERAVKQHLLIVTSLVGPICLIISFTSDTLLTVWIGKSFAFHSAYVLRVLAIGIFMNSLSSVPFSYLQAMRRADLTAKFHLIELPFYLVTLIALVRYHGIVGAAFAWLLRVCVDFILLSTAARFLQKREAERNSYIS